MWHTVALSAHTSVTHNIPSSRSAPLKPNSDNTKQTNLDCQLRGRHARPCRAAPLCSALEYYPEARPCARACVCERARPGREHFPGLARHFCRAPVTHGDWRRRTRPANRRQKHTWLLRRAPSQTSAAKQNKPKKSNK